MLTETCLTHPFGELQLRRWPRRRQETLRAWDSADGYLLQTLAEQAQDRRTLVVNDQWGALWLAASQHGEAYSYGDSYIAWAAAQANGQDNGLTLGEDHWLWPADTLPTVDQVLIRVPKELALLERQLALLAAQLPAGTPLWLAGMDKHLPRNLVAVMNRILGNGQAGLGWKKARLFRAVAPGPAQAGLNVEQTSTQIAVAEQGWSLVVHAGVFAQQQLDIGARLFIQGLPDGGRDAALQVADLGCGNGVIGMSMLASHPRCSVTFCDESWLALQSARENVQRYFPQRRCQFHLGDGLQGLQQRFDLILLNPPFHQGHEVGDSIARRLFRQAQRSLADGGELRVVGNRHLGYHRLLGKLFSQVSVVTSNSKFVVWRCSGPR